jgi:hypothetical protein
LPDTSAASRPAPQGWRETLARMARTESKRLATLAKAIEGGTHGTRTG